MVYRKYEDSLMVYEIYSVCYKMIAVLNHVFILVIVNNNSTLACDN
jgi:hypothetical protein